MNQPKHLQTYFGWYKYLQAYTEWKILPSLNSICSTHYLVIGFLCLNNFFTSGVLNWNCATNKTMAKRALIWWLSIVDIWFHWNRQWVDQKRRQQLPWFFVVSQSHHISVFSTIIWTMVATLIRWQHHAHQTFYRWWKENKGNKFKKLFHIMPS